MKNDRASRGGFALIIILAFLALIVGVIAIFLSGVTTELEYSNSTSNVASTRSLADSAVNIVMAQIADSTKGIDPADATKVLAWASQPGMIRTYDNAGLAKNFYKLYSSDKMVITGTGFDATGDVPASDWNTAANAGLYVDLNAPVLVADPNGTIQPIASRTTKYSAVYPVLDPFAEGKVDGFSLTSRPGFTGSLPTATNYDPTLVISGKTANPAPMPVKWLYVLSDGTVLSPSSVANGVATIGQATQGNPIVGRVAFWTDDETAKVNINTASEGTYWDVPRACSPEDFGTPGLATCQPAQHEYQRYPGHPASTCLSPILKNYGFPVPSPVSIATSASGASNFDPFYSLTPRIISGGSKAGSLTPGASVATDQDRLYATLDELMFTPTLSSSSPPGRVPNTAAAGATTPNLITKGVLEQTGFFLTANSSAPEVTMFNTPRISMWPVWADATKRTAYDNVSTLCSTVGGIPFHFTRSNARSSSADYTTANTKLYQYLQALTGQAEPGFGGNFLSKFAADRDQILTLIYDYIRCINIADSSAGATPYTPLFNASTFSQSTTFPLGAGEVVPIRIGGTKGVGRMLTVTEGDLLFYGTHQTASGATDKFRAVFLLQFASPMEGLPAMQSNLKYTIKGLENFMVKVTGATTVTSQSLNFVKNASGDNGTNYIETSDIQTYAGRSLGGVESPAEAFFNPAGTKLLSTTPASAALGSYPFCSTADVTFTPSTAFGVNPWFTMNSTTGGAVTVQILISTRDTNELVQTINMTFPAGGSYQIPGVVGATSGNPTSDFNNRLGSVNNWNGSVQTLIRSQDTIVGVQIAGTGGNAAANATDNTAGDYRLIAPLDIVADTHFRAAQNYLTQGVQFAHGLIVSCGALNVLPLPFGSNFNQGPLANLGLTSGYPNSYNNGYGISAVPTRVAAGVTRKDSGPGSWDSGIGDHPDGAYMNKTDEGDGNTTGRTPYRYGGYNTVAPPSVTYFSPNRQVPSPLIFGSIPTGVQRLLPWQTLLFHPVPEDPANPQIASPADHLIADLFWMPVVEPYAISQPLATSGKVNLNYQIMPFNYIQRKTGLYSVLKSTEFLAIPATDFGSYKVFGSTSNANRRLPIDIPTTLQEFDTRFSNNDIFRSASEICGIDLIPSGQTAATMAAFWKAHTLTGNNLRNKPYADIYPRLTTKSNTYTVHVCVQALKKSSLTPVGVFADPNGPAGGAKDAVVGEYRGSTVIERYLDPNQADLPDFAQKEIDNPSSPAAGVGSYYRFRVVNTKRFAP